ncbi:MAG TPA: hypothetical protein VF188_14270, partial [Longimicrobiales bacterium]
PATVERLAGPFVLSEAENEMPEIGFLAHPWWIPVLYVLAVGHLTNICVTLFLHRSMTHEGVVFHPVVAHAMRLWLWLTTGMNTREWVAVHRKHHAFADREGDPHSPAVEGFWAVVLGGVFFYRKAIKDRELVAKYGRGCPDDWIERHVYTPHGYLGLFLMMGLDVVLFGLGTGLLVWSFMAIWMPIMGNIINGLGHALGYRNFSTKDESRNLYPLGIWIVGEELHNNHHADPRSAKFKAHWWEFDIGWIYIRLLSVVRLAKVLYARGLSAKEFAEKYYAKKVDQAAHGIEEAVAGLEKAVARLERSGTGELDGAGA